MHEKPVQMHQIVANKYVTVVANAQTFVKMFMKKTLLSNYVLFT